MARFQYQQTSQTDRRFLISLCLFAAFILLFYVGFSSLSEGNQKRQRESLENALQRSIVHYYALEGRYPENLEILEDAYGLTYDKARFFVDYRLPGSNIFPDITIIEEE